MRIGLHISTNGGAAQAIETFAELGGEAAQILAGAARSFYPSKNVRRHSAPIPVVVHSTYVINPGAPTQAAIDGARRQVEFAAQLGADYFVLHAGSSKDDLLQVGIERTQNLIDLVVGQGPVILVENMGHGRKGAVRGSLGRVRTVLTSLARYPTERAAMCLDLAHAWAAGEQLATIMEHGKDPVIPVVHANVADKGTKYGSHRDRHSGYWGGEYSPDHLAKMLAHVNPDVAIIEAPKATLEDVEDLKRRTRREIEAIEHRRAGIV